ncbi:nectin-4-like [Discoglossus pictus]
MPVSSFLLYAALTSFQIISLLIWCLTATSGPTPEVKCEITNEAIIGGNVTLKCDFSSSFDVLQVTWQKEKVDVLENMATYSRKYGLNILKPFDKHIIIKDTSSCRSYMSIYDLKKEDEACYICLFNAYPHGAYTGQVCLTFMPVPDKLQMDRDVQAPVNVVTCSATGKSPPNIIFQPQDIESNSTKEKIDNKDGTLTFTRKSNLKNPWVEISCDFKHNGGRKKRASEDHRSAEMFTTECSATGKTKPVITWVNEGNPIIKEEKEIRGDIINVTSIRRYSADSVVFQDKVSLTCIVKYPSTEADIQKGDRSFLASRLSRPAVVASSVGVIFIAAIAVFFWHQYKGKAKRIVHIQSPTKEELKSSSATVVNVPTTPNTFTGPQTPESRVTKRQSSSTKKARSFIRDQCSANKNQGRNLKKKLFTEDAKEN